MILLEQEEPKIGTDFQTTVSFPNKFQKCNGFTNRIEFKIIAEKLQSHLHVSSMYGMLSAS
jgi:hypothetical protein